MVYIAVKAEWMDMDLIDFREVMDKYITHTLREDEIARSNRVFLLDPYFEGITDTKES